MSFVLCSLSDMDSHTCKRVRNPFGLSGLGILTFRYLFDQNRSGFERSVY